MNMNIKLSIWFSLTKSSGVKIMRVKKPNSMTSKYTIAKSIPETNGESQFLPQLIKTLRRKCCNAITGKIEFSFCFSCKCCKSQYRSDGQRWQGQIVWIGERERESKRKTNTMINTTPELHSNPQMPVLYYDYWKGGKSKSFL